MIEYKNVCYSPQNDNNNNKVKKYNEVIRIRNEKRKTTKVKRYSFYKYKEYMDKIEKEEIDKYKKEKEKKNLINIKDIFGDNTNRNKIKKKINIINKIKMLKKYNNLEIKNHKDTNLIRNSISRTVSTDMFLLRMLLTRQLAR